MSDDLLAALVDRCIEAGHEHKPFRAAVERLLHDFAACAHAGLPRVPSLALTDAGRLALAAHMLDRDDVHWGAVVHPGGIVWPTALAVGAGRGSSAVDIEQAVVAGYEILVRLGTAYGPAHRRHWQPTATAGPAAAALVAALLARADAETARDAVAHALSVSGGSIVALAEGVPTRWFHRLHAVDTGIAAARFAVAGCAGTRLALEGAAGLLDAFGADGDRDALGGERTPAIAETSVRIAAVPGWALAAVAAAAALGPVAVDQIDAVEIVTHPGAAAPVVRAAVVDAVARALLDGAEPLLPESRPRADAARVAVVTSLTGDRADGAATVAVAAGGERRSADAWPPDHPEDPATPERLEAKWRALWGSGWPQAEVAIDDAWRRERPAAALAAAVQSDLIATGGEAA